jgi:hypothetical protein
LDHFVGYLWSSRRPLDRPIDLRYPAVAIAQGSQVGVQCIRGVFLSRSSCSAISLFHPSIVLTSDRISTCPRSTVPDPIALGSCTRSDR